MKKELHLFIIWKNAFEQKNKILDDLKKSFKIRNKFLINWSDKNFSNNLSRFYGTSLPDGSAKEVHCGRGEFLLLIVEDENPVYEERSTSHGPEVVNVNMFDKKTLYREWTGGGHRIHATNSPNEFNHDITLLLGLNNDDFQKKYKANNSTVKLNKDVFGADTWKTVEEMFYALNNCTTYALLRNWESLPEEIYVNEHNDIDLICVSKEEAAYILNAKKAQDLEYRVQYFVDVNGNTANFDLRYVGDDYYDKALEERILKNRVYNKKGFYVLNDEDYFYTLLYHALVQKPTFKEDYKIRLCKMDPKFTKNIYNDTKKSSLFLEKWMIKNKYVALRPYDETVYFNQEVVDYLKPLVYKDDDKLVKSKLENEQLLEQKRLLENDVNRLNDELNRIVNSKGWKFLEKLRKFKRIFKK